MPSRFVCNEVSKQCVTTDHPDGDTEQKQCNAVCRQHVWEFALGNLVTRVLHVVRDSMYYSKGGLNLGHIKELVIELTHNNTKYSGDTIDSPPVSRSQWIDKLKLILMPPGSDSRTLSEHVHTEMKSMCNMYWFGLSHDYYISPDIRCQIYTNSKSGETVRFTPRKYDQKRSLLPNPVPVHNLCINSDMYSYVRLHEKTSVSRTLQMVVENKDQDPSFVKVYSEHSKPLLYESNVYGYIKYVFEQDISENHMKRYFLLPTCTQRQSFDVEGLIEIFNVPEEDRSEFRSKLETQTRPDRRTLSFQRMGKGRRKGSDLPKLYKFTITDMAKSATTMESFMGDEKISLRVKFDVLILLAVCINYFHMRFAISHNDLHWRNILVCKNSATEEMEWVDKGRVCKINTLYYPVLFDWDGALMYGKEFKQIPINTNTNILQDCFSAGRDLSNYVKRLKKWMKKSGIDYGAMEAIFGTRRRVINPNTTHFIDISALYDALARTYESFIAPPPNIGEQSDESSTRLVTPSIDNRQNNTYDSYTTDQNIYTRSYTLESDAKSPVPPRKTTIDPSSYTPDLYSPVYTSDLYSPVYTPVYDDEELVSEDAGSDENEITRIPPNLSPLKTH